MKTKIYWWDLTVVIYFVILMCCLGTDNVGGATCGVIAMIVTTGSSIKMCIDAHFKKFYEQGYVVATIENETKD